MYIKPEGDWKDWYNEERGDVNFTWNVRELKGNKMKIKLAFNDPTSVSPFTTYDKLVTHIPNVSKLFDKKQ